MTEKNGKDQPQWIEPERIYAQNFFYNNAYFSTLHPDINPTKGNQIIPKKKKNKQNVKPRTIAKVNLNITYTNIEESFDTKLKQEFYPDPGKTASSILSVFSSFSNGIDKLYPDGEASKQVSQSISETDKVHLLNGMHILIKRLDFILDKQIFNYMKKNNMMVNYHWGKENTVKEIIENSLKKQAIHNQSSAVDNVLPKDENEKLTSEKIKKILDEHKIEVIARSNESFICYLCNEVFHGDPVHHIINISHIGFLARNGI